METQKIINCPNCGQALVLSKIKPGLTLSIPCLHQWNRNIGCGYIISITVSEKKYGEK